MTYLVSHHSIHKNFPISPHLIKDCNVFSVLSVSFPMKGSHHKRGLFEVVAKFLAVINLNSKHPLYIFYLIYDNDMTISCKASHCPPGQYPHLFLDLDQPVCSSTGVKPNRTTVKFHLVGCFLLAPHPAQGPDLITYKSPPLPPNPLQRHFLQILLPLLYSCTGIEYLDFQDRTLSVVTRIS